MLDTVQGWRPEMCRRVKCHVLNQPCLGLASPIHLRFQELEVSCPGLAALY